ncbi:glycoside hydrolase family 19 protein [Spirosoma pulveris]
MPTQVTLNQILQLAPNARSSYRNAIANGQAVLDEFKISQSNLRVAHFWAQIMHESDELTVQVENLNYSPKRLPVVWPKRFKPKGPLEPTLFAFNPQKLANEVYAGRNGNTAPTDGFTYRGRGLIQLTGKGNYKATTTLLRKTFPDAPDFVINPDGVISTDWCLKIAAAKWSSLGCNELADKDSITQVTQAINGGQIGIEKRRQWLEKTRAIWG